MCGESDTQIYLGIRRDMAVPSGNSEGEPDNTPIVTQK